MVIRFRRWLRVASLLLLLFVGVLALAAAATQTSWFKDWLRRYVTRQAQQYLNAQVSIGKLDGNLFTGVELEQVALRHDGEIVLAAKDIGLTYSLRQLVSGDLTIDTLRINEPTILLRRGADGWNLAGLVKAQAQEADREGPARPLHIGVIGVSNGTITIVDAQRSSPPALPARIDRIDLRGAFSYEPVDVIVEIAHLSLRTAEPALALNSLSGRVRVHGDDLALERLAVRTAESTLSASATVRGYLASPDVRLQLSSDRLTPREFAGFLPALSDVRVTPAVEVSASGPLEALDATLAVRSDAGNLRARALVDAVGPERGVRGDASVEQMDLCRIDAGLPASRVTGAVELDLALDAREALSGHARLRLEPTMAAGYVVEALDARARLDEGNLVIDATGRAYGARATAKGTVQPPIDGRRPLAARLDGHIVGLDLRRLPRATGAPRLATRLTARYAARTDARGSSIDLVFDESTVEGAAIAAGTQVRGGLATGAPPTASVRGSLREVDVQRLAAALGLRALEDDRLRGRIDLTIDAEGVGRTPDTFEGRARLDVTRATLLGGEMRDGVIEARLARGAVEATAAMTFTNLDPALAARRPDLAGAVGGALDVAVTVPDVTAPSLADASGRVQLTLTPSRVGAHIIDRAELSASLASGVVDVASLAVQSPLAEVSASGPVAVIESGQSALAYHVVAPDLALLATLAGQPQVTGAARLDGALTGHRAELQTTGTLSLANAAYGTTARVLEADVKYEAALPALDPQRARVTAEVTADAVSVSGQDIRHLAATVQYADRRAGFDASVEDAGDRTVEAAGSVTLEQPSGVTLRVDRLRLAAEDVAYALAAPATVSSRDTEIAIDRLALVSGAQRIEMAGAVALGVAGTQAIAAEQPLRLTVEGLDLALVDRLARSGRRLSGTLTASATASGRVDAPVGRARVAIRDGAVGDFAYRAFDADVTLDATATRVEARLDQNPAWLSVTGTLPPVAALRDGDRRASGPLDVRLQSSAIDLAAVGALTTMVTDVTGTLQADVHLSGTLKAPNLDGAVRISGGAFTLTAADTPFTGLEADVALRTDRVDVRRLELADRNGRRLIVTGGIGLSLAEGTAKDLDLRLAGQDVRVLDSRLGTLAVDVDLGVRGTLQALRAEGAVTVRDGRIEVDRVLEQVRPATPATTVEATDAGAQDAAAAPSFLDAASFDVRVSVPNNLVVRGDGVKVGGQGLSLGDLNMTLGGDLRASKASGDSPLVIGSIRTVRGFYEFQGRRFELRRDGAVSFKGPDPTNPQLDIRAARDISGVEARVRVHGEARSPVLELSSSPPLDEGDILSLIIFNRPLNDLGEGEKTTLAQRAGSFVGGFVAAPVAEALRDALDVDLLEIAPTGEDGGGGSVSIGNQIGDRVFVKVRQQFGSSERTQLVLEYELTDFLRLETTVSQGGDTSRTIGRRAERGGADLVFVIKY